MADNASHITPAECKHLQLSEKAACHEAIEEIVLDVCRKEVKPELPRGTKGALGQEDHTSEIKSKIHRFPSNLTRFGTDGDYITPRTVALGPYYHGRPELQVMEKIKRVAVECFFQKMDESQEATYERFKPITHEARRCYVDATVIEGIPDDEFTAMMFIDGCFLVQYMDHMMNLRGKTSWLRSIFLPHYLGIERDMLLFENQIPWMVIEFFMGIRAPLLLQDIIIYMFASLGTSLPREELDIDKRYRPSHLLGLLVFYLAGSSKQVLNIPKSNKAPRGHPGFSGAFSIMESFPISERKSLQELQVTTSAAELAEMGIKLKASKTMRFSDMSITEGMLFANLSIPPWSMHNVQACWLVNMAAFEMCTATGFHDEYHVNSYICVVALLMNQDDDVRELRVKHILQGFFGDKQTLEFIKGLAPNLSPGPAYGQLIVDLAAYKHKRWVWIAIYRFFYNNAKAISAVLPIIGVLVGIFKTLLSLKQKQQ